MVEMKSEKPTVAVIGSGFSGVCTFIELQNKLGIKPQLFEMNKDIGGTWMANTYPGCSCDIPSHLYSLRSDPNPDWSQTYSPQPEILEYIKNVAKKRNIYEHIQFETEVIRAAWIQERKQWRIDLRTKNESGIGYTEDSVYYDILFSGAGLLRVPNIPPEFKAFKGQLVHTAYWDSSIDYKGKRVALVGSGSSALQTVPFFAENTSKLVSYQRSPAHVYPRPVAPYSEFVKWIFRNIPLCMLLYRFYLYFKAEYIYLFFGYPDSWITKRDRDLNQRNIESKLTKLGRPDLIPVLKPSYKFGCKRLIFSSDYFDAVVSPNVTVVKSPIKEINGNKIVTEDGQVDEVDILVLGTGFKTQEGFLGNIEFFGDEGQSLTEMWKTKLPQFYNSTVIHGFPNLFFLLGPTTILGHSSVVLMIETQVNFAVKCIKQILINRKMEAIEPKSEAQDRYMAQLRKDFTNTVWTSSCTSWYKNEDGEITNLYPNTVTRFKWDLKKFIEEDFVKYPRI